MSNGDDKLKKLYQNLVKEGYDLPDENTFRSDMSDTKKRQKLHSSLIGEGYDLPDFNAFTSDMGFGAQQPKKAIPAPQIKPQTGGGVSNLAGGISESVPTTSDYLTFQQGTGNQNNAITPLAPVSNPVTPKQPQQPIKKQVKQPELGKEMEAFFPEKRTEFTNLSQPTEEQYAKIEQERVKKGETAINEVGGKKIISPTKQYEVKEKKKEEIKKTELYDPQGRISPLGSRMVSAQDPFNVDREKELKKAIDSFDSFKINLGGQKLDEDTESKNFYLYYLQQNEPDEFKYQSERLDYNKDNPLERQKIEFELINKGIQLKQKALSAKSEQLNNLLSDDFYGYKNEIKEFKQVNSDINALIPKIESLNNELSKYNKDENGNLIIDEVNRRKVEKLIDDYKNEYGNYESLIKRRDEMLGSDFGQIIKKADEIDQEQRKNYEYAKNLEKTIKESDKFPELKKELINEAFKKDLENKAWSYVPEWGKATIDFTNGFRRAGTELLKGLAFLPKLAGEKSGYGWTDKFADFSDEAISGFERYAMPVSANSKKDIFDYERNPDGSPKLDANGNKIEKTNYSAIPYQLGNGVGNLAIFMLSGGSGTALEGVNVLSKVGLTGNALSKVGTFAAGYTMAAKNNYDEAKANGMSETDALKYSQYKSIIDGGIELIFPEQKLITPSTRKASMKLAAEYISKGVPLKDAIVKSSTETLKNVVGENVEELSAEFADYISKAVAEKATGTDFNIDDGLMNKVKSTVIVTSIITAPFGIVGSVGRKNQMESQSLFLAANKLNEILNDIDDLLEAKVIDQKQAEIARERIKVASEQLKTIPEDLSDDKKASVLPQLVDKAILENKKKETNPAFHANIDNQIKEKDAEIEKEVNRPDNGLTTEQNDELEDLAFKKENGVITEQEQKKLDELNKFSEEYKNPKAKTRTMITVEILPEGQRFPQVTEIAKEEFETFKQNNPSANIVSEREVAVEEKPVEEKVTKTESKVTTDAKADIERRRQEELSNIVSEELTEENRRPNGSIGTQGFDPTQMKNLITFLNEQLNLNIDEKLFDGEKLRPIIDFIKNNKEIVEKIKEYVKTNPIEISRMPDGSLSFRDGNHRANLLNLIGSDILPTIEVGQRNKIDEINAKYDAELNALENKQKQEDAIQEQTTGQVPLQPETKIGGEMEEGKPEAGPEVVTEEGIATEEKIKEIERRRQESLASIVRKDVDGDERYSVQFGEKTVGYGGIGEFSKQNVIDDINAKYDAELNALKSEAKPKEEVKVDESLKNVEYTLRRPEKNEIIFVNADDLLRRHEKDQPEYDITKKENQIGNRVEKAKQFIKNYILDNRFINPRTGERTNTKITFEPSLVYIGDNGKLGFEDGRHRVLAAKELGYKTVAIEVPKEQVELFKNEFKTEIKTEEKQKEYEQKVAQEERVGKPGEKVQGVEAKTTRKRASKPRVPKSKSKIRDKRIARALERTPKDAYEIVLQAILGGVKFKTAAFQKLFGNKRDLAFGGTIGKKALSEARRRFGIWDNKKGYDIKELAEKLWQDSDMEIDDTEFRDAVEQALLDHTGISSIVDYFEKEAEIEGEQYKKSEEDAYISWFYREYGVHPDELNDYWENLSPEEQEALANENIVPDNFVPFFEEELESSEPTEKITEKVTEAEKTTKQKAEEVNKKIDDFVANLKGKISDGNTKNRLYSAPVVTPEMINNLIDLSAAVIKKSISGGATIAQAVENGINAIRNHPRYKRLVEAGQINEKNFEDEIRKNYEPLIKDEELKAQEEAKKKSEVPPVQPPQQPTEEKKPAPEGKKERATATRILENKQYHEEVVKRLSDNAIFYDPVNVKKSEEFVNSVIDQYETDGKLDDLVSEFMKDKSDVIPDVQQLLFGDLLTKKLENIASKEQNEFVRDTVFDKAEKVFEKTAERTTSAAQKLSLIRNRDTRMFSNEIQMRRYTKRQIESMQNNGLSDSQKQDIKDAQEIIKEFTKSDEFNKLVESATSKKLMDIAAARDGDEKTRKFNDDIDSLMVNLNDC